MGFYLEPNECGGDIDWGGEKKNFSKRGDDFGGKNSGFYEAIKKPDQDGGGQPKTQKKRMPHPRWRKM